MEVEDVRFVSDRYEWASLTKQVPSLYHQWEWAEQSRRRIVRELPTLPIDSAYLRIWAGDTLIGCPVVQIDDVWFNAPRALPMCLLGEPLPAAALAEWAADDDGCILIVVDDSPQIADIHATRWLLECDADDLRSRRSLAPIDIKTMLTRLSFESEHARDTWVEAVGWVWRAGWNARLIEYRRNDEPIGWSVEVEHTDSVTVLAAAHVEMIVADWTSPR